MVRNRKVFKKTVSIVNEKSTDMYESLVGEKVTIRIMTAILSLAWSRKKL